MTSRRSLNGGNGSHEDQQLRADLTKLEELGKQICVIKDSISHFLLGLSKTSLAFSSLTEALADLIDPSGEQFANIYAGLLDIQSCLSRFSTELSYELPEPMEQQMVTYKSMDSQHNNNSKRIINSDQTGATLHPQLQSLQQNCVSACCDTWLLLLKKYTKENVKITKISQNLTCQLMDLQAKALQSANPTQSKSTTVPGSPNIWSSPGLSAHTNGMRTFNDGEPEVHLQIASSKPDRPLRSRELEALQKLSSSSQHVDIDYEDAGVGNHSDNLHVTQIHRNVLDERRTDTSPRIIFASGERRSEQNDPYSAQHRSSMSQFKPLNRFELPQLTRNTRLDNNELQIYEEQQETRLTPRGRRSQTESEYLYSFDDKRTERNSYKNDGVRIIEISSSRSKNRPTEIDKRLIGDSRGHDYDKQRRDTITSTNNRDIYINWNRLSRRTHNDDRTHRDKLQLSPSLYNSTRKANRPVEMVVTHSYIAQDIDELNLSKNDVVRILPWPSNMEEENGWLFGERVSDRVRGLFPVNYTRPR
ncbi:hypothetical protein EG68_08184 [Paragonimus skrjabini miyazakii]|uniref:SH3 domain-containing protein n=1 Tax=Paragonimus skrjabini miyazakii TaxID=59628 RepID=A0A8S9YQN4_9TREM|nr:hypothetical protein EG68_08184 [Paragonimus skrjabini miyazakii]